MWYFTWASSLQRAHRLCDTRARLARSMSDRLAPDGGQGSTVIFEHGRDAIVNRSHVVRNSHTHTVNPKPSDQQVKAQSG